MEKARILNQLIEDKGISIREFSKQIDMPYSTLLTILKNGASRASVDNIIKICKGLGIKVDDLDKMATGEESNNLKIESKIKLIARKATEVPDEDMDRLLKTFEDTLDVYLKARGQK